MTSWSIKGKTIIYMVYYLHSARPDLQSLQQQWKFFQLDAIRQNKKKNFEKTCRLKKEPILFVKLKKLFSFIQISYILLFEQIFIICFLVAFAYKSLLCVSSFIQQLNQRNEMIFATFIKCIFLPSNFSRYIHT